MLVSVGGTLILMDGIYTKDTLNTPSGITMQADTGARPIIVHSDGKPPAVNRSAGTTLTGLWFGGTRPANEVGSRTITNGAGGGFTDCTFFGYINCIQNGSDAHGNIYRRNRFVNCGYGTYYHPLYIANMNSDEEADGVLSEENIMVGCEGFSVHYYHEPAYGLAQYNFIGDGRYGLALQGDGSGPVSGNRNIIWTVSNSPLYDICTLGSCDNNVFRGCSQPGASTGGTFDGNFFVDPVPTAGTNPVVWDEDDIVSNFGDSSANIDAAIAVLETSFAASVATIQADSTIEANFATLKAVIDTWKTK